MLASVLKGVCNFFLYMYILLKLLCTVYKVSVWNKQIKGIKRNAKIKRNFKVDKSNRIWMEN